MENIQVREAADRNKPNCFELYSVNNDVIKACKTDSEGKVVEGKYMLCMDSSHRSHVGTTFVDNCKKHEMKSAGLLDTKCL